MSHRERLSAPVGWWIGAAGIAATCGWLVYVATTPVIGAVTVAIAGVIAGVVVWASGALVIRVDGDQVRAGRAHIGPPHLGEVEALDHAAYRRALGPGADTRAWIVTRPWIDTGVRLWLDDPTDPHPYWLIGSRRPERLAAAIADLRQTGPTPHADIDQ